MALLWGALLAVSCVGSMDGGASEGERGSGGRPGGGQGGSGPGGTAPFVQVATGLRRLTKAELRATIKDLLLVDAAPDLMLLSEESAPFDNDYTQQTADQRYVEGVANLAESVALLATADTARRQTWLGCATPSPACLQQFITNFGRRTLRRPLAADEVAELQALAGMEPDFFDGVGQVIRALLQDAEFLYRIEIGSPTDKPGVSRLNSWEVASRLSYLLWGTTPTDELLTVAANDGLNTPDAVAATANKMLHGGLGETSYARVKGQVSRFHGMWLGYEYTTSATLSPGILMRAETSALLERTIFQKRASWLEIFRAKDTFVNDTLAAFYGDVSKPGSSAGKWMPYSGSRRQGILSHGTFLSVANGTSGDTSLTLRGKNIRNRLLCEEIAPPPPNLKADIAKVTPQGPNECKIDFVNRTRLSGGSPCLACHTQMDPIGLGLENYDMFGKYRRTDNNKPNCTIAGQGQLQTKAPDGSSVLDTFQGPGGLSQTLVNHESKSLGQCLVTNFLRFALGRPVKSTEADALASYEREFDDGGQLFDKLVLSFASSPDFGYRIAE